VATDSRAARKGPAPLSPNWPARPIKAAKSFGIELSVPGSAWDHTTARLRLAELNKIRNPKSPIRNSEPPL
jgi:hypothetical protein